MTARHDTGQDVSIRDATVEDLPAIVRLLADDALGARRETVSDPLPRAYYTAFEAVQRQAGNRLLVAEDAGAIVGCLQLVLLPGLSRMGATRAQIEAVRVAGAARGRRIGERLVRHAIDAARLAGCRLVQLTSDRSRVDAHRFYERLGFVGSHLGMKLEIDDEVQGG